MNKNNYVSIRIIIEFLKSKKRLIISAGFIGLITSGIYVLSVPVSYEAQSILSPAYIYNSNTGEIRIFNHVSETTKLILQRIDVNGKNYNDCGSDGFLEGINLSPSKSSKNSTLVKVSKPTSNLSIECIKAFENSIITFEENKFIQLTQIERTKIDQFDHQINLITKYLSNKDIRTSDFISGNFLLLELENKRTAIAKDTISEFSLIPSNLINQISVSRAPSFLRITSILMAGFLAGLFISCLLFFKPLISGIFIHDKNIN